MPGAILCERMLARWGCERLFRALSEQSGERISSFLAVTQNAWHAAIRPQAGDVSVAKDAIDYAPPGPDDALGFICSRHPALKGHGLTGCGKSRKIILTVEERRFSAA